MRPSDLGQTALRVLWVATALNEGQRMGGIVDLTALRLAAKGMYGMGRASVDSALLDLSAAYVIDLLVAQSPTDLNRAERADGIETDRGLVYYVGLR